MQNQIHVVTGVRSDFVDHFSTRSKQYSRYRPRYPLDLFAYLSTITSEHERAWDCGTGTGQAAVCLADYYSQVVATDASSAQIGKAEKEKGVVYAVARAEHTDIQSKSVDLITVAQALHWFDIAAFNREADRVLKPGGALAIWTYNLMTISPEVDQIIHHLYGVVLKDHWPEQRIMVEEAYKGIDFTFREIRTPHFRMSQEFDLAQLLGYLHTWSAVKKYEKNVGHNPITILREELSECWGDPGRVVSVSWPLTVRAWIKDA